MNNLLLYFDEKILNEEFELEISVLNSKIDNFQKSENRILIQKNII